jgi:hypothetical protein
LKKRASLFRAAQTIVAIEEANKNVASRAVYQSRDTPNRRPDTPNHGPELRRTQDFLSAFCLVAANKHGWKSISAAASIESKVENRDGGLTPEIVIRLAQNEIVESELSGLREIMNTIVSTVNGETGEKWRRK